MVTTLKTRSLREARAEEMLWLLMTHHLQPR